LAINKSLKVDQAVGLCRKVVVVFLIVGKGREIQQQKDLPLKKLKGDVCTRWSSKADMIERIMEQQDVICMVLRQDR